jgi:hypothetical protein
VITFDPEVTGWNFDEFFFVAEGFYGVASLSNDSFDDSLLGIFGAYQTHNLSSLNFKISGFILKERMITKSEVFS